MLENILESTLCHVMGANKIHSWGFSNSGHIHAENLRTRSAWRTLLWTNFLDLWVSRSLALNRTIQNRVLSRDKDFQKKFLKWSENDELSEEYYSQTRSQLTFIPL